MKPIIPSEWTNCIIRCSKLGHEVNLKYCAIENNGLPCTKILQCWKDIDGLENWLRDSLGEPAYSNYFGQSLQKPKVLSLVELIEKFKK